MQSSSGKKREKITEYLQKLQNNYKQTVTVGNASGGFGIFGGGRRGEMPNNGEEPNAANRPNRGAPPQENGQSGMPNA